MLGSTNGTTFSQIVGSAGYTFNPSTGNTVTISLPSGTSTRYVQLSFTANTGWSAAQLSEFEVFPGGGVPARQRADGVAVVPVVRQQGGGIDQRRADRHGVQPGTPPRCRCRRSAPAGPFSGDQHLRRSIAADGTCTVSVTFTPTAAGSASGTLSVASNAPASPLTVALSGTGTTSKTNLALNEPVTASGYTQAYVPANAVDGNTSTYWESTDNAFPQWFQVDWARR